MANHDTRSFAWLPAGTAAFVMLLTGCNRAPDPADAAPPAREAPAQPAAPGEMPPPDAAEPAPSPPPDAPPPTEPSPVPTPTSTEGPSLDSMSTARPGAKIGVPVELRYSFEAASATNPQATLHLAAIPRVSGTRLRVRVKPAAGIVLAGSPLQVEKASAAGVYRQSFAVTRADSAPDKLRVLVTMDQPGGSGFGYFTVLLSGGNATQKQESVKQR
jgi:hypothetical protein